MVCAISCSIAFMFIIANVYLLAFNNKTSTINGFISKLSVENQQRYKNITNVGGSISMIQRRLLEVRKRVQHARKNTVYEIWSKSKKKRDHQIF